MTFRAQKLDHGGKGRGRGESEDGTEGGGGEAQAVCCCLINESEASRLEAVTFFPLAALGVGVLGASCEGVLAEAAIGKS